MRCYTDLYSSGYQIRNKIKQKQNCISTIKLRADKKINTYFNPVNKASRKHFIQTVYVTV